MVTLTWRRIPRRKSVAYEGTESGNRIFARAYFLGGSRVYVASASITLPDGENVVFREGRARTMRAAINRLNQQLDRESIGLFNDDGFNAEFANA